ncbi:MAG: hypothetical protein WC787_04745 [Patescibacteria group bacterium]|jgi:hypothetical protein
MMIQEYINVFPKITEKGRALSLFIGIINELDPEELLDVSANILDQDIFKRKVLIRKIKDSINGWSADRKEELYKKLVRLLKTVESYHKKESIAVLLASICSNFPIERQKSLLLNFLVSEYTNNRKRAYAYLFENWSPDFSHAIETTWSSYEDEDCLPLLIEKMSEEFLMKNFTKISAFFGEDQVTYDFRARVLRNKLYSRIFEKIPDVMSSLRENDPISYLFILKTKNAKVDLDFVVNLYKHNPDKSFLPRWIADLKLWHKILESGFDPLTQNQV